MRHLKPAAVLVTAALLLSGRTAPERHPVSFQIRQDYGAVDYRHTGILRPEALQPFLEKLAELKSSGSGTVSILHIGDSHVQADFFSGRLRTAFQQDFGNAGRGLVVPARVARSNESPQTASESGGKWEARKIIYTEQPLPAGIGGYTFSSEDSSAWIRIRTIPPEERNRRLMLFLRKTPASYWVTVRDSADRIVAVAGNFSEEASDLSRVVLPYPMQEFRLQAWKTLPGQNRITLFGMALMNDRPGVLYHATGVNGAKFRHYAAEPDFSRQAATLAPDLVIVSLGTNEATEHPYQDPKLDQYITRLVESIRSHRPGVPILLTTPPGSFRQQSKKNPSVEFVRERILGVAESQGLAVADLWQAGGGSSFTTRWKKSGLMQPDGIHYTPEGYRLQGEMIYLALIEAYNAYVTH